MKKIYLILSFVIAILVLNACFVEDSCSKHINIINVMLKDGEFSKSEYSSFIKMAQDKSFLECIGMDPLISLEDVDSEFEEFLKLKYHSNPNFMGELKLSYLEDNLAPPNFKIYIENGASMDGYIRGRTDFESVLMDLVVQIDNNYSENKPDLFYISPNPKPIGTKINDFVNYISELEPIDWRIFGRSSETKVNNLIENVVRDIDENEVAILISDYIYSVNGIDTEGLLNSEKYKLKNQFWKTLSKSDLSTLILKFSSNFNGNYYDRNDSPTKINDKRPYYIWVFGNKNYLTDFEDKIDLTDMVGFQKKYNINKIESNQSPYLGLLLPSSSNYKISKRSKNGIIPNPTKYSSENPFEFHVILKIDDMNIDNNYLMNENNYMINEGKYFKVKDISEFSMVSPIIDDFNFKKFRDYNPTHIMTITSEYDIYPQILKIKLLDNVPEWIAESSTLDDRNIENNANKTFGFKFLVNGIKEAYQKTSDEENIFSFDIEILNQ